VFAVLDTVLRLEQVGKKYGRKIAVQNISFSVRRGEIVGLVGPNGAGKTTLMRIIVGLLRHYEGRVFLNERPVKTGDRQSAGKIGCMIETPGFYPYLSGYENLKFLSAFSGRVPDEKILETARKLGLAKVLHQKVRQYSLGMRQRLAIALAVLHQPSLLVLDEPANGLDPAGILEMRDYLRELADKSNIAILISSHHLSEIERICDRVAILNRGAMVKWLDMKQDNEKTCVYVFETNRAAELAARLRQNGVTVLGTEAGAVLVQTKRESVAAVIRTAAATGIDFTAVYERKETLEQEFLEAVGGVSIE